MHKHILLFPIFIVLVLAVNCFQLPVPENYAPNPPVIICDTLGTAPDTFQVIAVTTDPDGDSISYAINFNNTGYELLWSAYYPSGYGQVMTWIINSPGTYYVKALAKDVYEDTSDWSEVTRIILH